MTYAEVIARLRELRSDEAIAKKAISFGIAPKNSLGIFHRDLVPLAKSIGHNADLARQLAASDLYEARLLASKLFRPADVTSSLADQWMRRFDTWEICDSYCMGLIAKSPLALSKARTWSTRKAEYQKRAAFATIAALCMADKHAENKVFESLLEIIDRESTDDRLYVKKAVNWALRNIGKRNIDLNRIAVRRARDLAASENSTRRWIGSHALRELEKPDVSILNYPRKVYGARARGGAGRSP